MNNYAPSLVPNSVKQFETKKQENILDLFSKYSIKDPEMRAPCSKLLYRDFVNLQSKLYFQMESNYKFGSSPSGH